ncbi:undecaprenyldiphospho-muramoylpentapeptide beta-N-acetylglucosaminyltransferase [Methylomagnum ishizawai]|uniref:undecaprenyldiphospho-muramoylpentapeptide beta-N-acetylglucosaminyltransferase n=1 Tax=Methylomagnum ishizawai TaxID=1760988 RepID=UPI001C7E959B|nr:undecaprenyldiphospho-muramoylpentapeptide beta-N-acetylglucosaminyltransferase [Methylomagnum ishizawai]
MGTRIMILAGGTGGHVYPALAVARELLDAGHDVVWMGTRTGLEARVVPAAGIPMEWLSVAGLRGKGWRGKLTAPFMLLRAFRQALGILRRVKPDAVLGMGGFVSGPGGLLARMLGIPLVLHEQNRIPGTTNRWLARRASVVLEAFPDSFPAKMGARCVGNPLRREIVAGGATPPREDVAAVRLLIVGGSLGAKALNETVPEALARIGLPIAIRHQTGAALREETQALYARHGLPAQVDAFVEDMAAAYAWADLAICRAGAMTVSELAATGVPAILVPYPHAIDDHQTQNARYLADAGAAVLLPQPELNPERLAAELKALIGDPARLATMKTQATALARPEAARVVAAICLEATHHTPQPCATTR